MSPARWSAHWKLAKLRALRNVSAKVHLLLSANVAMDLARYLCSGLVFCPLVACTATIFDGEARPDASSSPDAASCARVEVALTEETPTVMLLIDRSGSMTQTFGTTDRWSATFDTLMNPTSGVVKQLEAQVRFGIALYTSLDGSSGTEGLEGEAAGTCPMLAKTEPALNAFATIQSLYGSKSPQDDTPTGAAITKVAQELAARSEIGPKIIVLATDGLPDSCANPDPAEDSAEATAAREESVGAARSAFLAGIRTYVISVGPEVTQSHLQDLANAGAGLMGGTQNAAFYRALSPQELVSAFDQIIGDVRSCTFTLDGEVDPNRSQDGKVTLDGRELGPQEWSLTGTSTIEILGSACEELLSGTHVVRADFACAAIVN